MAEAQNRIQTGLELPQSPDAGSTFTIFIQVGVTIFNYLKTTTMSTKITMAITTMAIQ